MRFGFRLMAVMLVCCIPAAAGSQVKKASAPAPLPAPTPMTKAQITTFMGTLKTNVATWQQAVGSADIAKLQGSYPAAARFGRVVEATRQTCLTDLNDLSKVLTNLAPTNLLLNVDVSSLLPQLRGHLVVMVVNLQIYGLYVRETGGADMAKDVAELKQWSEALSNAREQANQTDAHFAGHMVGLTLSVMKQCDIEENYPNCNAAAKPVSH